MVSRDLNRRSSEENFQEFNSNQMTKNFDELEKLRDEILRSIPKYEGQIWYAISKEWFNKFNDYVNGKDPSVNFPGKICFSDLILKCPENVLKFLSYFSMPCDKISFQPPIVSENILKSNLIEEIDYTLVPDDLFQILRSNFSIESDEKNLIKLEVVKKNCNSSQNKLVVDIYRVLLFCFTLDMKIISSSFSLKTTISDVIEACQNNLNLPRSSKIRLFFLSQQSKQMKLLDNIDLPLEYYGINNFDALLIDEYKDNEWLYDKFIKSKNNDNTSNIFSHFAKFLSYIGLNKVFNFANPNQYLNSSEVSSDENTQNNTNTFNSQKVSKTPILCGLFNLGNTCYMNSALQSVLVIREFIEYFLIEKSYKKDINPINPLGSGGKFAHIFFNFIENIYNCNLQNPCFDAISPQELKYYVSIFLPQFQGYSQQDSQEFLIHFLNLLHEDLNLVKNKPYFSDDIYESLKMAALNHPQRSLPTIEDVAVESWRRYAARNNSIIVDLFHGMLKSRLTCCNQRCDNISNTFDPMVCLSLPVPVNQKIFKTLVYYFDFSPITPDECFKKFEIFATQINARSLIYKTLEKSHLDVDIFVHSLSHNSLQPLLTDSRNLMENCALFVFRKISIHDCADSTKNSDKSLLLTAPIQVEDYRQWMYCVKNSGIIKDSTRNIPIVIYLSYSDDHKNEIITEKAIKKLLNEYFMKLNPSYFASSRFDIKKFDFDIFIRDQLLTIHQLIDKEDKSTSFSLKSIKSIFYKMHSYPDDECVFAYLNMINFTSICPASKIHDTSNGLITIYDCLDLFVCEEQLQQNNLWYCPSCKNHVAAYKKIDLWTLPNYLIIHFKRFRFNYISCSKIDTFIDFPIKDLDLLPYTKKSSSLVENSVLSSYKYDLISIVNHFGTLNGGHYTASVYNQILNGWYNCNDSHVSPIRHQFPKKSDAYLLIYKKKN